MADVFSEKKRSEIMSKIRSKHTKVEVSLRKKVWNSRMRYRLHCKKLPGKPDFVFPSKKIAVFVDGCFWHGCPKCYRKPKNNKKYWEWKLKYNKDRDKKHNKELRKMGWRALHFWEHEIKKSPDKCVEKIKREFLKFLP